MTLAAKLNIKWNRCAKNDLKKLIPNASHEAINLIESSFFWDPKRRPTVVQVGEFLIIKIIKKKILIFLLINKSV